MARIPEGLQTTLERARELGFLGPGPIGPQIRHAEGFALAYREAGHLDPPGRWLDLGSGGGLPGLVLAHLWPETEAVLLDASERRVEFLRRSIEACGLEGCEAWEGRAELIGHQERARARFDAVVARSFGPPAVTAECAAPLLRVGGVLVVSATPGGADHDRWPPEGLAELGLAPASLVAGEFSYRVSALRGACPDRFPRRTGVPAKRPLF